MKSNEAIVRISLRPICGIIDAKWELTSDEFIQVGRCHRAHRRVNDGWIRPVAARLNNAISTCLSTPPRRGSGVVFQRARRQHGRRIFLVLDSKHWRLLGPLGFSFSDYLAAISKLVRRGRSLGHGSFCFP